MEEVWRDTRWIMDALQYARYKQPTGGISISWIIDFSKEVMLEKPPSTSSQPDFMPSPMPSPEPCRKHSGQIPCFLRIYTQLPKVTSWCCFSQMNTLHVTTCRFCWTVRWGGIVWSLPHHWQWLWLQSSTEPPWIGPSAPLAPLILRTYGASWFPAQWRKRLGRRDMSRRGWTRRGSAKGFYARCPPGLGAAAREGRWAVRRRGRRSVCGRTAKGSPRAVWQWLHPAQQADRAFAHHREETGVLCENQQSGVSIHHLSPPSALLPPCNLPFFLHLTSATVSQALVGGPLLFCRALPITTSTSSDSVGGQRHPETLLTITCYAQERLPHHAQSAPAVPHRPPKGDQR